MPHMSRCRISLTNPSTPGMASKSEGRTWRYLETLVIPELLSNMSLAPGLKSPDASKMEFRTQGVAAVVPFENASP